LILGVTENSFITWERFVTITPVHADQPSGGANSAASAGRRVIMAGDVERYRRLDRSLIAKLAPLRFAGQPSVQAYCFRSIAS
jgi:hypothetical protein